MYRSARVRLLDAIDLGFSNRDPLSEFSEAIVLAQLGGRLAESRVQHGYDLTTEAGERVQVKYLANPPQRWINEHHIKSDGLWDRYALVIYEELRPNRTLVFPAELGAVGPALGKRHPRQDSELQFTKRNHDQIVAESERFRKLDVDVLPIQ
jgi:hypothetical protein